MTERTITSARLEDLEELCLLDRHITSSQMRSCLEQGRILVIRKNDRILGWLRFGFFWDEIPFMHMLFIREEVRKQGLGKELVRAFEQKMLGEGYRTVMTSTASNEYAQHFYTHLGYQTIGGFTLPDDPFELILYRELKPE